MVFKWLHQGTPERHNELTEVMWDILKFKGKQYNSWHMSDLHGQLAQDISVSTLDWATLFSKLYIC